MEGVSRERGKLGLFNLHQGLLLSVPIMTTPLLAARGGRYALLLGFLIGVGAGVGNTWAYQRLLAWAQTVVEDERRVALGLVVMAASTFGPPAWVFVCCDLGARPAVWLVR